MSLYLDSAIIEEAASAAQSGWIYGITTNPTLLAKSGFPPAKTLQKLAGLPVQEVFYQVKSTDLFTMLVETQKAQEILKEKLVVKIPPTPRGFEFAARIAESHTICLTAIFSPAQALVARQVGADYIAVYVNRATHLMGDGIQLTRAIAAVLSGSKTQILAASLKSSEEVVSAFTAGAHHLTLPYPILTGLIANPHSDAAVAQFDQTGAHLP